MNYPELERTVRRRLWGRLALRLAIVLAAVVFALFVLPPIISNFFPFIAALIMTWFLHPLVRKIHEKLRIPSKLLSLAFVIMFMTIVGGAATLLVHKIISEVFSFVNSLIENNIDVSSITSSDNIVSDIIATLPENIQTAMQNGIANIVIWIKETLSSLLSSLSTKFGHFISGVPSFFVGLVVFLTATYYVLADYANLRTSMSDHFTGELRKFINLIKSSTFAALGAYLRAQLLLSLGVFIILLVGFFAIGQNYALLLAFVLAILDFVPLIGSGVVLVPWAIIAFITGNMAETIQLLVIWGITVIFRRALEPKIVGSQTGLTPLLALASIYVGMRVAGVTGMILAPIILQVFIKVCEAGVFKGLIADVKLFVSDCVGILKNKLE